MKIGTCFTTSKDSNFKTFLLICSINFILIFSLKSEFAMTNLVSETHRQITEGNQDKG